MSAEEKITIRKATTKNIDAIINVLKSTKLSNEAWEGDEKWVKKALEKALDAKTYILLVAIYNHKIVGFIDYVVFPSLWECADQGMINHLFVHETFQGKGVGARLIKSVVERADAEGLGEVHVSTGWENTRAKRLYGKFGFTEEQLLLERSQEK